MVREPRIAAPWFSAHPYTFPAHMNIPPGHTEASVLEAIEKAVAILAPTFVFGYFDVEDVRQQARMYGLQLLETGKYDPTRPLANLAYRHISNRLINWKRDQLRRSDTPCRACHNGNYCQPDGPCPKYAAWWKTNQTKSNLLRPLDLTHIADEKEPHTRLDSTVEDDVAIDEIVKIIDAELPVELRATFLQMRAGVSVPKPKRIEVENAVKEILREHG